mmetsp:Transcript_7874/g.14284  ORF Transcript_7874/g.14284 Transcript_7874/m.14284 type:complete len:92 (-) Transcript_7874:367-642(-)
MTRFHFRSHHNSVTLTSSNDAPILLHLHSTTVTSCLNPTERRKQPTESSLCSILIETEWRAVRGCVFLCAPETLCTFRGLIEHDDFSVPCS